MARRYLSAMGLSILTVIILCFSAWAVPQQINYQGKLTDQYGDPVADGSYDMAFSIYNDAHVLLWSETRSVSVSGGIYNVQIGQDPVGNPFPADLFEGKRYLGVKVGSDPEMTPRQPLTSVPFALKAADAETLDGMDSTELDQSGHLTDTANPHNVTAAQVGAVSSSDLDSHAANASAHHSKTTSFAELTDQASDAQIPNDISISQAVNADTVDGQHANAFATSAHNHDGSYYTKTYVDALENRIVQLEKILAAFTVSGDGKNVYITGANLHIVNGTGATSNKNGLGNLIVGYNELRGTGDDRTGSHNIVVGREHNYSYYGGLVAGYHNTLAGGYAGVSGGAYNTCSGGTASVSGGYGNTASGQYSSVSGGSNNTASGYRSSVSGGSRNQAIGEYSFIGGGGHRDNANYGNKAYANLSAILGGIYNITGVAGQPTQGEVSTISGGDTNRATGGASTVSGGVDNTASGWRSAVSGGEGNTASGIDSSVSGGFDNEANGYRSAVSGGGGNMASGIDSSVSGGVDNEAIEDGASVSGGFNNTASGRDSSVSGGVNNTASGQNSSISGGEGNKASGQTSSASGGRNNEASGYCSFIGGGGSSIELYGNKAYANYSAILGGIYNITGVAGQPTQGEVSTISGGDMNKATGGASTVSGGVNNTASGWRSAVSGGNGTNASTTEQWCAGWYCIPE